MEKDALFEGLRALREPPLDPALDAAVLRRARAMLEGARARRAIDRVALPLLVTSAVAGYLVWLVRFLAALRA